LKVLFTIHEYSSFSFLGKIRILLSIIFSQRIIIPEKKNIIEIAKLSPSLKKRITYIPIGSNIRPKEGKSFYSLTDEIIIGYFGIIRPKKGIENLLESFIYLNDERINLLIIGEIDERNRYHKKIKKLIDDYGLIERVKITGYCNEDEVRYHLLRTDLMVLPFPEGVSERRGTFLAAVTHGVPVITTKSNTIPEGLKDGENIKLIEPGSSKVLAEAIMELIRNDELRRSIGLNGLKWSQRFTWQKILESHISIYFSLIKN
jgi:glycosyltransferase involved in cell wall biosynthesis